MRLRGFQIASNSVLRVILSTLLISQQSNATSTLSNVTTSNGVITYQTPNENVYLINAETPQNITFSFPTPSIPEKTWSSCSVTNSNITSMSINYVNNLLEEWLDINIEHQVRQFDYSVTNAGKIIFHDNAKKIQKFTTKIMFPNGKTRTIDEFTQFHFQLCSVDQNTHVFELTAN